MWHIYFISSYISNIMPRNKMICCSRRKMGLVAQCNCSTYNQCMAICDSATHANVKEDTSSITIS